MKIIRHSLRALVPALSILLIPLGALANDIEPGKEYYTAIKAVNPIVLDGDLSEWTGSTLIVDPGFYFPKGSATNPDVEGELVFFEEYNGGTWTGADDQTSAVQVVYDDDNVYVGVIVTDDYHENSNLAQGDAWDGDSVQLHIANAERDTQIALYNYALGGTVEEQLEDNDDSNDGDVLVHHESGPGGTDAVIIRNTETKRTIYEIKLPKASMALENLGASVQFGLGMAINDGDKDSPGQKGWSGLGAHSIVHGKSADQTARITLARANDMEPGKEHHSAKRTPGEIVLDGELGDWEGVPVLSDPRFTLEKGVGSRSGKEMVLHEEWQGGTWTGPDDQTSAVQIAYDSENVYLGITVTDDYHEHTRNSAWNGDSVQLYIANDKTDTQIALYNYALGGTIEGQLTDNDPNNDGEVLVHHESGPGGTEAFVTRDPNNKKTTYEIKLPKESMLLETLEAGTQFGLGMAINDGDEAPSDGQKGWGGLGAHSIVHGKTAEETALVTLDGYAPRVSPCFASAITPPFTAVPDAFSFRANNAAGCEIDPATAEVLIDGNPVELVATPAGPGETDYTHVFPQTFPDGSVHTYSIKILDAEENVVIDEIGEFKQPIFVTLTSDMQAARVDKSKPGFIWRIFQNEDYVHNSLSETEAALAGELVEPVTEEPIEENRADESQAGPAIGPGVAGPGELIEFEIPTVINLNAAPLEGSPEGTASFGDDDQMPGLPGVNGVADGADAEIITYVEFPAGRFTVGVNSDDGFRLEAGSLDSLLTIGEFGRGRGSFDSIMRFEVEDAGIYPVRVIWFNGAGGATIELFQILEDGTKVLFNDIENGGFPTYRAAPEEFLITDFARESNGDVALTWLSKAGRYYAVDTSTDLTAWESIITEIPEGGAAGDITSYTDGEAPADAQALYYRVRQVPAPAHLSTDFENGAEGWGAFADEGDTTFELGTPDGAGLTEAASGENVWGTHLTGEYGPDTVARLRSPVVDVTGDNSPRLSFNYYNDTVLDVEGTVIQFLDENGELLASLNDPEQIITGQTGGWIPFSVRFPGAARETKVIVEFMFLSDGDGDVGAGFYIDDVRID